MDRESVGALTALAVAGRCADVRARCPAGRIGTCAPGDSGRSEKCHTGHGNRDTKQVSACQPLVAQKQR